MLTAATVLKELTAALKMLTVLTAATLLTELTALF